MAEEFNHSGSHIAQGLALLVWTRSQLELGSMDHSLLLPQAKVERVQFVHHPRRGKILAYKILAAPAQGFAPRRVVRELEKSGGQSLGVAGLEQETRLAVTANFSRAIAIVSHDRPRRRQGLGQGARQTFAPREVDDNVHQTDEPGNFIRSNEAGEHEMFFQAKRERHRQEASAPLAIAHEEEFHFRTAANQFRCDGEQIFMALQFEKSRDLADDEIVRRQAEPRAQSQIIFRREERREVEAAEDFGVLFRSPDTRSEVLPGHGIGDHDEVRGNAARAALGGAEDLIGERALKRTEGRPVNRVDNLGHTGTPGGQAAENSSLAAVSVDQIGALGQEQLRQSAQR